MPIQMPGAYRSPYDRDIEALMLRRGDVAARGAEASGQIWGGTVRDLGGIAGQAFEQYQQEKIRKQREAAFTAALEGWDPADPQTSIRRLAAVTGPEDAIKFGTGLLTYQSMMQKNAKAEIPTLEELKAGVVAAHVLGKNAPNLLMQQYPTLRQQFGPAFKAHLGFDLPEEPTPEILQGLAQLGEEWSPPKKRNTAVAQGNVVDVDTGQVIFKAEQKPKEYQVTVPGPNGPVTRLATEDEMRRGVREYQKPAASIQVSTAKDADERVNAQSIVDGRLNPTMVSKRDNPGLLAEADRVSRAQTGKPFNFNKALLDYEAARRHVVAMNSTQQVRFRALADTVVNTMDEVKRLAEDLKQGDVQKFNRAKRSTILELYGNTPQSELAARYLTAVNTLKEEFANLAQGGFAPTESAWALANDQINTDYGVKDFVASVNEAQRLINYRMAAFADQTPSYLGAAPAGGVPGGAPAVGAGGAPPRPPKVPSDYHWDDKAQAWLP